MADFDHIEDLLPEGATPLIAMRIVKYLNADGEGATNWHLDGNPTRQDTAGLLEIVKYDMLRSYLADLVQHSDDEED